MQVDPDADGARATWTVLWCGLLIVVVALVAFAPLMRCQFTDWDDPDTIWANPHFRPATLASVGHYWRHAEGELYIPLTYTMWGGLSHLGQATEPNGSVGPDARTYHAANLIAHVATALAAFALLRRLLRNDWAACAGALLFALHPVQTETVAWASGMKDLLAGFFVIVALWQYVAWVEQRRRSRYVIALLAMALGMLCKPTAVVMPLLALFIDLLLLHRPLRVAARSVWPLFAMALPCVIWTKLAQPAWLGAGVPLLQRPIVACDALAFYLWKLVWPARLAMDYGRTPAVVMAHGWVVATCVVPLAIVALLWTYRHHLSHVAIAALLFVCSLLPVLGFVPFEFQTRSTVADHYLYLPMLGVALAAAWAVRRFASQRVVFYTAAIVLGALALRTLDQTRYWKDSRALFAHAIEVNPNSFCASQNLAVLNGYDAEMLEAKAQVLHDGGNDAAATIADADARAKLAESERLLAKVLAIKPGDASALHTRAALHAQFKEHRAAIADLQTLLAELPTLRVDERETFLGDYDLLGQEFLRVREPASALISFNQMLQLNPGDRAASLGRQRALAMLDKPVASTE